MLTDTRFTPRSELASICGFCPKSEIDVKRVLGVD
jgi:hypothetical protein